MEIFKDFGNNYSVSNYGRVYSKYKKRYLAISKDKGGYCRVSMMIDGKEKKVSLHRLVAMLFLDSIEGKEEVNHKDGNKENNKFDNLEWCSRSENIKHSYEKLGYSVGVEKKIYIITPQGEEEYESLVACCLHYGISIGTPHALFAGITKSSPKMNKLGILKIGYDKNNMYITGR